MKKLFTLFAVPFLCAFLVSTSAWGQTLLLEENFDYPAGDSLTAHGWTAHSSATVQTITVSSGGLTYAGYPSSGIGNAALVDNNGEDDNRTFTAQTSGTIYYSFLVKVDIVANGYFIHLMKNSTTFAARVFVQIATGGFNFGVSNSTTVNWGSTVFSTGTTYLCVVKYDFSTSNVDLWVFSSGVPASEVDAGTPEASNTGSGQSSLGAIALRQYSSSQNFTVDGIRIATDWSLAPLPVELTSFTATTLKNNVLLTWSTATETQNAGFEVERRTVGQAFLPVSQARMSDLPWTKVGFVKGAGNSTSPKSYSFSDPASAGHYAYRLKQINLDGSYKIYQEAEVNVALSPAQYTLSQNYPNPFNPSTMLSFAVHAPQHVSLKVFNLLGQEVATLFNGMAEADVLYKVAFNAAALPSGVYFSVMKTDAKTEMKRMLMMR
jgi:hypothetical protein